MMNYLALGIAVGMAIPLLLAHLAEKLETQRAMRRQRIAAAKRVENLVANHTGRLDSHLEQLLDLMVRVNHLEIGKVYEDADTQEIDEP